MPMDPTTLAAEIKAAVQARNEAFSANIEDQFDWLFEAVAEAVIEHITTNMLVTGTVTTTSGDSGTSTSTVIT